MTAYTYYEQTRNEYIALVNRKKILEEAILRNYNKPDTVAILSDDLRIVMAKLDEIFENNINYFNDDKTGKK